VLCTPFTHLTEIAREERERPFYMVNLRERGIKAATFNKYVVSPVQLSLIQLVALVYVKDTENWLHHPK